MVRIKHEILKVLGVIIEKWIYIKFCYGTSAQLISVLITTTQQLMILMIFLKQFNLPMKLIITITIIAFPVLVWIGHVLVNHPSINIVRKENKLLNKYNPEIKEIHDAVVKNKNGKELTRRSK